jgi:hypothetical protein
LSFGFRLTVSDFFSEVPAVKRRLKACRSCDGSFTTALDCASIPLTKRVASAEVSTAPISKLQYGYFPCVDGRVSLTMKTLVSG